MHYSPIYKLEIGDFTLNIDLSTVFMIVVTGLVVFIFARLAVRNLSITNPTKLQKVLEWAVDFIRNIISSSMDWKKGKAFLALGLTLIMFIFVGNMLGLPFAIITDHEKPLQFLGQEIVTEAMIQEETAKGHHYALLWWKSPTADAAVTMGLALMVIMMTHFLGASRNTKNYFKHYLEPNIAFFPLNLLKEVAKLLTLGMRLFGNIFAGEIMISTILLGGWALIPLLTVWQGFSVFIGSIQAFIFTVLTMVYMSQQIQTKH